MLGPLRILLDLGHRHSSQRLLPTSIDPLNMRVLEIEQKGELSGVSDETGEEDRVRAGHCGVS